MPTERRKIFGIDAKHFGAPVQSEASIQRGIVQVLRQLSYTVLETSEHRRAVRCSKCGRTWTPSGGRGVDKGIADLLVSHTRWPVGVWLGLEVKTPRGVLSPEQKRLLREGRIYVVRSIDDALGAITRFKEGVTWQKVA